VSFDAVGSEEGIRRIGAGEVDFGASDMPLSAKQLQEKGKLLQFATVLGAVVPIYNVKGAPDGLNLTPEVLAGIFLGKLCLGMHGRFARSTGMCGCRTKKLRCCAARMTAEPRMRGRTICPR